MNYKTPELRRLRRVLRRIYPYVVEIPGSEAVMEELELEVLRIARLDLIRSNREGTTVHLKIVREERADFPKPGAHFMENIAPRRDTMPLLGAVTAWTRHYGR